MNPQLGPTTFRINNFDLIRLFAATQVLLFHTLHRLLLPTPTWLHPLEMFPGVPIFFVVSGYLISTSFERQHGHLGNYFRNRALRIYPALWACIALTVIVVLAFGYRFHSLADLLWITTQPLGLIYTPRMLDSFGSGTYNGSLWTIPLELQFYCLVPLIYLPFRQAAFDRTKRITIIFLLFVVVALVAAHLFPTPDHESKLAKLIRYTFMPQFYLFLFGMVMQRFQLYRKDFIRGKGLLWLALYVVTSKYISSDSTIQVAAHLLLGVTILSIAYTLPHLGSQLLRGQDISYGVYIYHGLFINVLVQLQTCRSLCLRFGSSWLVRLAPPLVLGTS